MGNIGVGPHEFEVIFRVVSQRPVEFAECSYMSLFLNQNIPGLVAEPARPGLGMTAEILAIGVHKAWRVHERLDEVIPGFLACKRRHEKRARVAGARQYVGRRLHRAFRKTTIATSIRLR